MPKSFTRVFALELLDVGDELADLDRIDERFLAGLTAPGVNAGNGRPRVKDALISTVSNFFR